MFLPPGTSLLHSEDRWYFRTSSGALFDVDPRRLPAVHQPGDFFEALHTNDPALQPQHYRPFAALERQQVERARPRIDVDIRGEGILADGIRDYLSLFPGTLPEGCAATIAVSDDPAPITWCADDQELAEQPDRWWVRVSVLGALCQIEPLARGTAGINHTMTRARLLAASDVPHLDALAPVEQGGSVLHQSSLPAVAALVVSTVAERMKNFEEIGTLTRINLLDGRCTVHPILPIPPCEGYPAFDQQDARG